MLYSLILALWDLCAHLKIELLLVRDANILFHDALSIINEALVVLLILPTVVVLDGRANRVVTTSHVALVLSRELSLYILVLVKMDAGLALADYAFQRVIHQILATRDYVAQILKFNLIILAHVNKLNLVAAHLVRVAVDFLAESTVRVVTVV